MKIELSQRASGGRRPAWSAAAWLRVLVLSLICAGVGLLWSSSSASADTGPDIGSSLASGTHALGQGVARTGKDLLGTRSGHHPAVSRADGRTAAKPADGATAAADHTVAPLVTAAVGTTLHSTSGSVHGISSRVGSTADPVGRAGHQDHATGKVGAVTASVGDVTDSVGGVLRSVGGTTEAVGSAVDGTTGIVDGVKHPDRLGSATGAEITKASGIVHAGDDVVRSTSPLVGSTGRTVGALGGDRSEPLSVVGAVGDTVTSVGSTVDSLGRAADDLDRTVATAAGRTAATTIDRTVGTTIGSTSIDAITETITNTVTRTAGDTITGVNGVARTAIGDTTVTAEPITSVVQPLGQVDGVFAGAADQFPEPGPVPQTTTAGQPGVATPAYPSVTAGLIVSAPVVSWLAPQVGPPPIAEDTASSETNARPAKMFAAPELGLGGGPVPQPGQLPQPTGEMITASASGGTWHEHAVLRSATNRAIGELLHSRGPWSKQPQATPYDPGYSPD